MPRGSKFTTGSFFLIDYKVAECFRQFREHNRITFALVAWTGFDQEIVFYDRRPRRAGVSGWTFGRMIKAMYDTFIGFSSLPPRLFTIIGATVFLVNIPFTLYLDLQRVPLDTAAWMDHPHGDAVGVFWPVVPDAGYDERVPASYLSGDNRKAALFPFQDSRILRRCRCASRGAATGWCPQNTAMSSLELTRVRVTGAAGDGPTGWAADMEVSVPPAVAAALLASDRKHVTDRANVADRTATVDQLRRRAAFTPSPPGSSRLPFSYQAVPLWARTLIGHAIGRMYRLRTPSWGAYPQWPLDLSADFLADLLDLPASPFAGEPAPVLLSHDIDTPEGLRNLVSLFLPIEEKVGAVSSNYIVPCAWTIDHALLAEVRDRGHEIGIHGYDHSNRTPFATPDEMLRRLSAARPLIERYGIIGYRAPSLLRTVALVEAIGGMYRYDSSIPTSGGLFPVPNNGCATARPFRLGRTVEIPLTLPRDGSLLFLGHDPREIAAVWRACAERIAASGGIVSLLTHCEHRFSGNRPMLDAYQRFLDFLADDVRFTFSTPALVLGRLLASEAS